MKKRQISFVLILFLSVLSASVYFFREARSWIGKPFPGFLLFANNRVGSFNQSNWTGSQAGLRYHDLLIKKDGENYQFLRNGDSMEFTIRSQVFSIQDFWQVFLVPFISGLLFLILGGLIFWVMKGSAGSFPFLGFNLALAYYLIGSFDFHTEYTLTWFYTLLLALTPAFMNHFALVFPKRASWCKNSGWLFLSYIISFGFWFAYQTAFYQRSPAWPLCELALVSYMVLSYLFWLFRLGKQTSFPTHPFNRVIAKSLLTGQILAFVIPLVAAIAVFLFHLQIPFNLIAPVTLLFPIAALFGLVLGNLRRTQLKLVQTEKMASLGQLLAGIAHEINNPTTFIYSNVAPLKEYIAYLKGQVKEEAPPFKGEMSPSEVLKDLESLGNNIEEGAVRTKEIIQSLKNFAKGGSDNQEEVDIHACLESSLKLLAHQIKDRITIHREFGKLPKIKANASELNQVWMNLLANAAQAISKSGDIWIQTSIDQNGVKVTIRDNGAGIPKDHLDRIFDPFFTTKEQGEGTGLGLAICQELLGHHKGTIEVSSEVGKGTTFTVRLPQT